MSDAEAPTTFQPRDAKELAALFPGYKIKHLVATGGMGAVYCALQESLDRIVAIKILPTEFSQDAEFCAAFEAEAKAMARLNHPNLIGVFDFGEVSGMLYIIMEYVEGETLHHITQGGIIKSSEALRLMQGICAGVADAHEHGILHRDIKPANILLDGHLQPKIGDFGLARPSDAVVADGETIYGTPGYTAPEVIEPPHSFDHRADIFSLGVMLHELITGKLPGDDRRPASAQVRCHPRIDAVIRKATQLDPAQRFQSAGEMAAELAKVSQPGLTKATAAIRLPSAAGSPQSMLSPATARQPTMASTPQGAGMLSSSTSQVSTMRRAAPQLAQQRVGALGGQPGALGGRQSTMMMSANSGGNTGLWVVVAILVGAALLLIVMGGGPDTPSQGAPPQSSGLQQMLNSQIGPEEEDKPTPPAPKTAPKAP